MGNEEEKEAANRCGRSALLAACASKCFGGRCVKLFFGLFESWTPSCAAPRVCSLFRFQNAAEWAVSLGGRKVVRRAHVCAVAAAVAWGLRCSGSKAQQLTGTLLLFSAEGKYGYAPEKHYTAAVSVISIRRLLLPAQKYD